MTLNFWSCCLYLLPSAGFRCALPTSVLYDPAQGLMHTRQAFYQPSYYSAPGREEMSHINQDDKPQRTDRWLRTLKTTQFEAVQLLLKSWIVFIYLEVIKLSIFFKCTKGARKVAHWLRVLAAPAEKWNLGPRTHTGGSPCNSRGLRPSNSKGTWTNEHIHMVFKMYTGLYSVFFFFLFIVPHVH